VIQKSSLNLSQKHNNKTNQTSASFILDNNIKDQDPDFDNVNISVDASFVSKRENGNNSSFLMNESVNYDYRNINIGIV
jgi:hypothetical protein